MEVRVLQEGEETQMGRTRTPVAVGEVAQLVAPPAFFSRAGEGAPSDSYGLTTGLTP